MQHTNITEQPKGDILQNSTTAINHTELVVTGRTSHRTPRIRVILENNSTMVIGPSVKVKQKMLQQHILGIVRCRQARPTARPPARS